MLPADCGPHAWVSHTLIEPLVGSLRHPLYYCDSRVDVVNKVRPLCRL